VIVIKFGGAALGDADNFSNVAKCVERLKDRTPIVVVSAMKDVTCYLIEAIGYAEKRESQKAENLLETIGQKHQEVIETLILQQDRKSQALDFLHEVLEELQSICHGISALKECTLKAQDYVLSFGEKLSARVLAGVLTEVIQVQAIFGEEVIVTDDQFGSAYPRYELTQPKTQKRLLEVIDSGKIPLISGFTGATQKGETTTLGRGGTDFSASIIGSCMNVCEVWFMKEVDGIMSADPRVVQQARSIKMMNYREVAELSFFGAKVLHPTSIHPLKEKSIPALIKNVYNPDFEGTRIHLDTEQRVKPGKAVTSIPDVSMISVGGDGMMGIPGVAGRAFTSIARAGVNILMISQSCSEQSICFAIKGEDRKAAIKALTQEFELELLKEKIDEIEATDDVAIVCLVGAGMSGTPGVAGMLFSTLGKEGINVMMIAQGSSEVNVSFLVEAKEAERAIQCIHQAFGLGK
jgi:bifunctional aspartokinase / homoserine dehydrogenase 1